MSELQKTQLGPQPGRTNAGEDVMEVEAELRRHENGNLPSEAYDITHALAAHWPRESGDSPHYGVTCTNELISCCNQANDPIFSQRLVREEPNFSRVFVDDFNKISSDLSMEGGANEPPDPAGPTDQVTGSPSAANSPNRPTRVSTPVDLPTTTPSLIDISVDMPVSPVMPTLTPERPISEVIPQQPAPNPPMPIWRWTVMCLSLWLCHNLLPATLTLN
jgi:hypothetical protein